MCVRAGEGPEEQQASWAQHLCAPFCAVRRGHVFAAGGASSIIIHGRLYSACTGTRARRGSDWVANAASCLCLKGGPGRALGVLWQRTNDYIHIACGVITLALFGSCILMVVLG